MKPADVRRANREGFDAALRFGALQLAIAVLGNAQIGHLADAYTVTEFTGVMYAVRLRDEGPYCLQCKISTCDHASLVRLYLARIGKHGLGA